MEIFNWKKTLLVISILVAIFAACSEKNTGSSNPTISSILVPDVLVLEEDAVLAVLITFPVALTARYWLGAKVVPLG